MSRMFAFKVLWLVILAKLLITHAEPLTSLNRNADLGDSSAVLNNELNTCEDQLARYRRFLLQAIISFEDVCDAYNVRPTMPTASASMPNDGIFHNAGGTQNSNFNGNSAYSIFRNNQPAVRRSEIWAFFKLLMAQFNDLEFTSIIRQAVIERCHIKSIMQHDEKRNSVILGKKQRFHSWGGKRSKQQQQNDQAHQQDQEIPGFLPQHWTYANNNNFNGAEDQHSSDSSFFR